MRALSKSKLLAFRQCPRRLWLEIHRKDLRVDSAATEASFRTGHEVGDLARRLYDPKGTGTLLDPQKEGFSAVFARTRELLKQDAPVFEAGFSAGGVLALADVMHKRTKKNGKAWDFVEVKSSTSVKDYHRDDVAIQSYLLEKAGVAVHSISLAHIDGDWVYPGNQNYAGIFKEVELTEEARSRSKEVTDWVKDAAVVAGKRTEPRVLSGPHCSTPFACGFIDYCRGKEPRVEYPVEWIRDVRKAALREHIANPGVRDMRDVPDHLLNEKQLRVKMHTLGGTTYFDREELATALKKVSRPVFFLDFETGMPAVPLWKGWRPYRQVPFQFSLHIVGRDHRLRHHEFLDLSGADPRRAFAEALVSACGARGTIFVFNAAFEKTRIKELAEAFPILGKSLDAILERIVDLSPLAEAHYYHPAQEGSWGLKAVIPTLVPELDYGQLSGIADGGSAMTAYLEAISPESSAVRKREIEAQLRRYCAQDTLALVHLWSRFSGESKVRF